MAKTPSLSVYQGDDRQWAITMTRSGAPFDLTDHEVFAQIREDTADADKGGPPIAEFTIDVTDAAAGEMLLILPKTESVKLSESVYQWDIQIEDDLGWTTTILRGTLSVTQEITRT